MTKMYKFTAKTNEKNEIIITKKYEEINFHSSIIDTVKVSEVYVREMARHDIIKLLVKDSNEGLNDEEHSMLTELENDYFNNIPEEQISTTTTVKDAPEELKELLIAMLYTQGAIIKGITIDEAGTKKLVKPILSYGMGDFYIACKKALSELQQSATLEDQVKIIKPLYNSCISRLDHEACEGICKKWTESTKEKNTRLFLLGLTEKYKITKTNRLKTESPLKSIETFEKYVLSWIITEGAGVKRNRTDNSNKLFTFNCFK